MQLVKGLDPFPGLLRSICGLPWLCPLEIGSHQEGERSDPRLGMVMATHGYPLSYEMEQYIEPDLQGSPAPKTT